tara:strand:- start:6533 stop:6736 length:204 start_codon:yes stop_codon:yes gene_type:complete
MTSLILQEYKVYPFLSYEDASEHLKVYSKHSEAQIVEFQKGYFIIKINDTFYVDQSGGFNTKSPLHL